MGKLKSVISCAVLVIAFSLVRGGDASAATKTWAGSGTGSATNWSTSSNWSPAGAPVDGDSIVFDCDNADECVSVFDIPGLSVSSINFAGAVPGDVTSMVESSPIVVNGDITSTNAGSVFNNVTLVLAKDVTINNTVIAHLDLDGHSVTFTGKGVLNGTERWVGIAGYIIGDGTINIDVDPDQEFYLAGANYYSGMTNVNSGKSVSNGQNPSNKTINMFGVSDVSVGPSGKVVFTFDESDNGLSFLNIIKFNRTNIALSQLLAMNKTSNNSLVSVLFPGVVLNSDTRFDVDVTDGSLSINLAGIMDNDYCIEFGSGNAQASYFTNAPDCDDTEPNPNNPNPTQPVVTKPSVPKTGAVVSAVVGASTLAGLGGFSLYSRRSRKNIDLSEK